MTTNSNPTFAIATGKVTFNSQYDASNITGIEIQSDGKIIVLGSVFTRSTGESGPIIMRYNADGSLDTSFSGDGFDVPNLENYPNLSFAMAQSDGKIIAVGSIHPSNNKITFSLMRYNADGSLDTSFSGDGITSPMLGTYTMPNAATVQADGKILVVGVDSKPIVINGEGDYTASIIVVRYNTDGSLDTSFSGDGKVLLSLSNDSWITPTQISVQPDGKILVSGNHDEYNPDTNGSARKAGVLRFNSDGTLDTSFGDKGIWLASDDSSVIYTYKPPVKYENAYGYDTVKDTVTDVNGKTVEALDMFTRPNTYTIGLQRTNPDGSIDTTFGAGNLNGTPTFTENGTAVIMDSDVQVFDAELDATGNYSGASLTITRQGGANVEDKLASTGTLITLTQGSDLTVDGLTIGTVTTNSNGTLKLTFNINATGALVNSAMQKITYANTSDTPDTNVVLDWTFNDGNTGSQGDGGALTASGSVIVGIAAINDAPIVANAITDRSTNEGAAFNFTVNTNTFTDAENDAISFSAALSNGDSLPEWLTFNTTTHTFSGTPTYETVGALSIDVTGTDVGGAKVSETFVLTINNVNDAPIVVGDVQNQFANEGVAFTYSLSNDLFIDHDAQDILIYTATLSNGNSLPNWLHFNAKDMTFTGSPANSDVGVITVKVMATDPDQTSAATTFSLDTANVVSGTTGFEALNGGDGSNFYIINNLKDTIIESANNAGTDTAVISVNKYSLPSHVERMLLVNAIDSKGKSVAVSGTLTGNSGDNYILGNSKNDKLFGEVVSKTATSGGNDVLNGGAGADAMSGGFGNDTYIVDNVKDKITEAVNAGTDLIKSSITYVAAVNVENLTLTGSANINATGNASNNTLTGNSGNNTLDGKAGADSMAGDAGNDTYFVDNAGDVITEYFNAGVDSVFSTVNFSLVSYLENLTLTGKVAINGAGNNSANVLTGNSAANNLLGNGGNDTLIGGDGSDTLTGGAGNDTFVFDSKLGSTNIDTITDFTAGDTINLSKNIFTANKVTGALTDADFGSFNSNALVPETTATATTAVTTHFIFDTGTGNLYYDADGNMSGKGAVLFATLTGVTTLHASDLHIV